MSDVVSFGTPSDMSMESTFQRLIQNFYFSHFLVARMLDLYFSAENAIDHSAIR